MADGQEVLVDLLERSTRTWQLVDRRGALARGTVSGAATRRDHVLLAAPGPDDGPLAVSLLRFDDRLVPYGGAPIELTPTFTAAARGDGPVALGARGYPAALLESFDDDPWPRWRWRGDGWVIEREFRMIEGHAALVATWRWLEGTPVRLHVAPLLVDRGPRELQRATNDFRGVVQAVPGRVRTVTRDGAAPLTLWYGGVFMPARTWQRGLAHPHEHLDPAAPDAAASVDAEDAFLPGWVRTTLGPEQRELHLVASCEEGLFRALASEHRLGTPPARTLADCVRVLDLDAHDRRASRNASAVTGASHTARQAAQAHAAPEAREQAAATELDATDVRVVSHLAARLHDAVVERADRTAIVTDPVLGIEYGPDALRVAASLITVREFALARDVLRGYLAYVDEGLAPEWFDPQGMPHYASPESSLWLVRAVDLLVRRDGESEETRAFLHDGAWRVIDGVAQHLRAGSRHGVRCDREGFLWAGEGLAARCRADLNALWYHALVALSQLAKRVGRRENAAFQLAWARELQRAYGDRFWDEAAGCLHPEYGHTGAVRGVTPEQLHAVALPPMLLAPDHAIRLVGTVTRELWDPRGLRTHAGPGAPDPAWLGVWAAASLRAHGRLPEVEARVHAALDDWAAHAFGGRSWSRVRGEHPPAELSVRGAADLLRAWVEEIEHPLHHAVRANA